MLLKCDNPQDMSHFNNNVIIIGKETFTKSTHVTHIVFGEKGFRSYESSCVICWCKHSVFTTQIPAHTCRRRTAWPEMETFSHCFFQYTAVFPKQYSAEHRGSANWQYAFRKKIPLQNTHTQNIICKYVAYYSLSFISRTHDMSFLFLNIYQIPYPRSFVILKKVKPSL
jgi:hypothetical protein